MEARADMLFALVELDKRGGYFGQNELTAALEHIVKAKDLEPLFTAKVMLHKKEVDEAVMITAYKIRVMLAHIRVTFDAQNLESPAPPCLKKIFEAMHTLQPACTAKKARRMERLGSRPHPFMQYRESTEVLEEQHDHEQPIVSKYFDGQVAWALKADGSTSAADTYDQGPHGFVIARWLVERAELEMEVPNACCEAGVLKVYQPCPVKKRPAAKMEKDQDGQNEDEGIMEEKEHDKEEVAWSLKPVPGHGNSMTIQVRSTGKDKAQLIAVSEKACSATEWSPLTACEHILKKIEGAAAGQL